MNPEAAAASDPPRGGHFPPQIKYIVGNEACERFSYYGMVGILEVYLTNKMQLGSDHATEILHLFGAAVYFLPLFGGWLADRWLGRYWTILSISLFYCLGHGMMALKGSTLPGLYAGLALIAIGSGGIKPCVAAFVGDQFGPEEGHLLTKVYGWFYWSVNFGATFAFLIIPWLRDKSGYRWAFGVPGIFMGIATLIFWLGRNQYVRRPPQSQSQYRPAFFPVVWYALTHQNERKSGQKFFDVALSRFPAEEVEGARAVAGILVIFVTVPIFWALYYQSNSTWVLQGDTMRPIYLWDYKIDGERMQAAGSVLVMILVPILTLGVYPLLESWGLLPTPLRRMSAGMIFGAASFVVCGFLQSRLERGASLSVGWQLAPYFVLEIGEVLLSATALEFAFEQAPASMKSIIMSFWLTTMAGGHFLIAVFTKLKEMFLKSSSGASQFYFYSVLMFVVAGVFIFLATRYQYREQSAAPDSGG